MDKTVQWKTLVSNTNFKLLLLILFLSSSCAGSRMARDQKVEEVISRARSYTGTPYRYGGTTTLGMDCSGLLMRSFEVIDIYIPRTAKEQSKLGKRVSINQLEEGDLVFFKTLKKQGRITHAGLVTDARKRDRIMVIHASSSRGVMEVNLMTEYYRKSFVKAKRIKF
ncbi:MAG: C40 family peptidase [Cyclobacteriaceae bacterium]|nr:C40 family peptidase [Cyclobacteriaceae bacterium]